MYIQQFLYVCSLSGCAKRDVAIVECSQCEQSYCIQHRHQTDHNCPCLDKPALQSVASRKPKHPLPSTTKSSEPDW